MAAFGDRLIRASRLDASLYEEVEGDQSATGQALAVVVLASLATGIGAGGGLRGLAIGLIAWLLGWYLWSLLTYWIGTRLLPESGTQATLGEMLRTIGFAQAPGILRVFGIIPGLYIFVTLATAIWMLIAAVVAIRQALDYQSTGRAVLVVVVGWIVQLAVLAVSFAALAAVR
jgi:Yip1 domain